MFSTSYSISSSTRVIWVFGYRAEVSEARALANKRVKSKKMPLYSVGSKCLGLAVTLGIISRMVNGRQTLEFRSCVPSLSFRNRFFAIDRSLSPA